MKKLTHSQVLAAATTLPTMANAVPVDLSTWVAEAALPAGMSSQATIRALQGQFRHLSHQCDITANE